MLVTFNNRLSVEEKAKGQKRIAYGHSIRVGVQSLYRQRLGTGQQQRQELADFHGR